MFYWISWCQPPRVSTVFVPLNQSIDSLGPPGPPATSELCMELSARMPWCDAVWNVTNAWGVEVPCAE